MEKLTIKEFQDKSNIEIIEELMKKIMDILLRKNLICLIYIECIFLLCRKRNYRKVASGIYIDTNKIEDNYYVLV